MTPLGILANMNIEFRQILQDFLAVDQYLSTQDGYGFFGFSRTTRYMHVLLILFAYYMAGTPELSSAVVVGTLIEIQQEQAAAAAAAA